jgi:WD40 repeat protein
MRRNLLVTGLFTGLLAMVPISRLHYLGSESVQAKSLDATLKGHRYFVQALAFGPGGTTLTSAAYYPQSRETGVEIATWDVRTGQRTAQRTESPGPLICLAFTPDGRTLAAGLQDGALLLWDVAASQERRLEGLHGLARTLALSASGSQLVTADGDEDLTIWDVDAGRPRLSSRERVACLAFAPGETFLASGGWDAAVRLWDAGTGEHRAGRPRHASSVVALAFSSDGCTLASSDLDGLVKLWDAASMRERTTLTVSEGKGWGNEAIALAFSPDGSTLAVAVDRVVQLWDVPAGRLVACLKGHERKLTSLAFAPDGRRLASGSCDKSVRLWDVERHRMMQP